MRDPVKQAAREAEMKSRPQRKKDAARAARSRELDLNRLRNRRLRYPDLDSFYLPQELSPEIARTCPNFTAELADKHLKAYSIPPRLYQKSNRPRPTVGLS